MKCGFFLVLHIITGRVGLFFRIRLNFKMKSVSVDWKDLDLNALNEITFKDFKKKKKIGKISKNISGVNMSMN